MTTHLHSDTVAPQGLLYCLSRRYARGMFPLSAHRHPGTGPGHPQRRTGRSKTCFLLWPAPCCMAGKTSLTRTACLPSWMPPQPVVGGEPPGTCQRDSRGTPPDPFACVSCRKKPIAIFCRVEVLDPARRFSFCPAGGDIPSPPAFLLPRGSDPGGMRQGVGNPTTPWLPLGGKLSPKVTDEGATLYPTER